MVAFFPLPQQLSRKRARQDTEKMEEEMEEAQVFARCGVLASVSG